MYYHVLCSLCVAFISFHHSNYTDIRTILEVAGVVRDEVFQYSQSTPTSGHIVVLVNVVRSCIGVRHR